VPPDNPVLGVGNYLLVWGHICADEDATVSRSNDREELDRAPPEPSRPYAVRYRPVRGRRLIGVKYFSVLNFNCPRSATLPPRPSKAKIRLRTGSTDTA